MKASFHSNVNVYFCVKNELLAKYLILKDIEHFQLFSELIDILIFKLSMWKMLLYINV